MRGLVALSLLAPGHAKIAFVRGDAVWSARADGSDARLLLGRASAKESLSEAVWSPDGTRLAYIRITGDNTTQLMLSDATGQREVTPLREGVAASFPAWSPDRMAIAYMRFTESGDRVQTEIVTRALPTGAESTVVNQLVDARLASVAEPAWSPDGATLAYTRWRLDREHDHADPVQQRPQRA